MSNSSTSTAKAGQSRSTWLTPSVILPSIVLLLAAILLFGSGNSGSGDKRLTSYSANADGVRLLHDVLKALDYPVQRRLHPMSDSVSSHAIYVLLSSPVKLSETELTQLLHAIRNGAGLIFSWEERLEDSLGFEIEEEFDLSFTLDRTQAAGGSTQVPFQHSLVLPIAIGATVSRKEDSQSLSSEEEAVFLWWHSLESQKTLMEHSREDSTAYPSVILGATYGRGRVVAVSDPDILRNAFAKDGRPIYAMARAIDWINVGQRSRLPVVFDEYHQGFGLHPNLVQVIRTALTHTPLGRTTLHIGVAAFVLLIALGSRAIAPSGQGIVKRRSLLEHVGALAHAYEQTNARSLALDRLIRGLRRRHPLGIAKHLPHDVYLARLTLHCPEAREDVEVLDQMRQNQSDQTVAAAGTAVARIEQFITAPYTRSRNSRRAPSTHPVHL